MRIENGKPTLGVADGEAASSPSSPRVGRSPIRRLLLVLFALAGAGSLALVLGFFLFAWRVPRQEVVLTGRADGIVALTGGASRVIDAIELLASGHGQRLLITGVYRTTGAVGLARRVPDHERLFACCIDLDHVARNTIGNAVETHRWTTSRGFRSLVVVTSSYHMPRALAEIGYRLPGVQLIPYPVVTEQRAEPWWSNPTNARLLMSEYVKYLAALVRMRIEPVVEFAQAPPPPRQGSAVSSGPSL